MYFSIDEAQDKVGTRVSVIISGEFEKGNLRKRTGTVIGYRHVDAYCVIVQWDDNPESTAEYSAQEYDAYVDETPAEDGT